jgi:hypothetical protein
MDCYDLIEWAGAQPWCNGKVGMFGVSYLAAIQYQVAPLAPPHLAAINPWEAFSDWYREFAYHGGIRESGFLPYAARGINWSLGRTDDTNANVLAHPLYDEFWESRQNLLEDIKVPAFVVASWTDQGFHTRGTLECFKKMRSQQKWLSHGQKNGATSTIRRTCASCRRSSITSSRELMIRSSRGRRIEARRRSTCRCCGPRTRAFAAAALHKPYLTPPTPASQRPRGAGGGQLRFADRRRARISTRSLRRTPS